MDFLKILRSFEDFVFEAVSWLIFYPLTLWRIMRHPVRTMNYSDAEQSQDGEARYDDAISPPLVLLATLVLTNMVGVALHQQLPESESTLLHTITASPQNLVLFRSLMFSLIPMTAAVSLVRRRGERLSRESVRAPFYAQCYLTAPLAGVISLAGVFLQRAHGAHPVAIAAMVMALAWFLAAQTAWYREKLAISWGAAGYLALRGLLLAGLINITLAIPIALI